MPPLTLKSFTLIKTSDSLTERKISSEIFRISDAPYHLGFSLHFSYSSPRTRDSLFSPWFRIFQYIYLLFLMKKYIINYLETLNYDFGCNVIWSYFFKFTQTLYCGYYLGLLFCLKNFYLEVSETNSLEFECIKESWWSSLSYNVIRQTGSRIH